MRHSALLCLLFVLVIAAVAMVGYALRGGEQPRTAASAQRPLPQRVTSVAPPEPPAHLERLDPRVARMLRGLTQTVINEPAEAANWMALAHAYHANDLLERAERCYDAVLEREASAPAYYHRSLVRHRRGALDDAVRDLEHAASLRPTYAPIHWRLGQLELERGRPNEATACFRRALEHDPEAVAAQIGLARAALTAGAAEKAVELLEACIEDAGANRDALTHLLATAYRRLDRLDEARRLQISVQDATPTYADAWSDQLAFFRPGFGAEMTRGRTLLDTGRFEEALQVFEKLRRVQPNNAVLLTNLGLCHRSLNRLPESIALFESVLAVDPGFYQAHFHLAVACGLRARQHTGEQAAGWWQRAAYHVQRALALNPSDAPAHAFLGDLRLIDGDLDGALAAYREAIRCAPDDARWYTRAGTTLLRLARWAEAEATLADSLARDGTDSEAERGLAVALINQGRFDAAQAALGRAERLAPGDPRIRETRRYLDETRAADDRSPPRRDD